MVLIRSHRSGGCSRLAPPGASQLVASPYSDDLLGFSQVLSTRRSSKRRLYVSSVSAALGSALTFLPAASHSKEGF